MISLAKTTPKSAEAVHTHTHTHTHTSNLVKNNRIYINKKDNIILPSGYYDTG